MTARFAGVLWIAISLVPGVFAAYCAAELAGAVWIGKRRWRFPPAVAST